MEHITMKKGFTILEVMMAVFVLTIAVGASYILIQQTFIASSLTQSKLVAYYLAQEGVENVRNIRDTNWINDSAWDAGISSGEEVVGFLDSTQSGFERKTFIMGINDHTIEVKVDVEWNERGRNHSIEVVNYLYDWYSEPEEEPQVCYLDGVPQTCDGTDATALGCTAGDEGCRRCDNGVCNYYISGQHSCDDGYECNGSGNCVVL